MIRVGETFEVRLAWRVEELFEEDVTGFVHFTNASGEVIVGDDRLLPTGRAQPGDVLVAMGAGLSIFLALLPDLRTGVWACGLIPALMGVGYLVVWRLQQNRDEADSRPWE